MKRRPVLLIGGGSGVVPLVSMLRERRLHPASSPMTLLYSVRTWDDVLFRDELLAGDDVTLTITREAARRDADFSRRIDAAMLRELLARALMVPALAYVCGTNAFVDAATEAGDRGRRRADVIRTERYGV